MMICSKDFEKVNYYTDIPDAKTVNKMIKYLESKNQENKIRDIYNDHVLPAINRRETTVTVYVEEYADEIAQFFVKHGYKVKSKFEKACPIYEASTMLKISWGMNNEINE